jgi:cytochrome P450
MATHALPSATKTIPFVKGLPWLGSWIEHDRDRLNFYLRVFRECGDVGGIHFGPFPMIMFSAPEFVHSILVEHAYDFDKGEVLHRTFRPAIGNGLFVSEGEFHRKQRKLMAPAFQPRQIMSYADTMVTYGERIVQQWHHGATIDVSQEMTHLTMSIGGKVLFDADVFTETDALGASIATVLRDVTRRLSSLISVPFSWPTPGNLRTKRAIAFLRARIQRMIEERRNSTQERNDFLSLLLHARDEEGKGMSDEQLMDEAVTLFGASHETTATALAWTWYLLATHPDIYARVQQEVDTVLQGRTPTYADLAHLPYCLQVFKETLRIYPPAYALTRVALHDMEIDGYPLHKLDTVLIAPYVLHRRPDYFPDPERFDPERFTAENEKKLPRYAYMPFGAGPRICIGSHFAMMEGHLLLATLAQRVTFELLEGQKIVPDPRHNLTIRPRNGVKVRVRRR